MENFQPPAESSPPTSSYSRNHKICNPVQYFKIFEKLMNTKAKLLKQLQQLDIDTTQYEDLSLNDLQQVSYELLKNTYSLKYIGVRDNQIGILSKRMRPNTNSGQLLPKIQNEYIVTGFFYPKPLKTVPTVNSKTLTTQNLENQIKRYFPKHVKKQMQRSVTVKGSWKNLKCSAKIEKHLENKDCNFKVEKSIFRSYSRTLERIGETELHSFNQIKLL